MSESQDMPDDPEDDGDDERQEDGSEAETNKAASKKREKKLTARDDELSDQEKYQEDLAKIASLVEQAFRDQNTRSGDQSDYWDIYECELNDNQYYNGNSEAYIPLVADAIDARQTRFTNQLFPNNGRYIEVTTEDGDIPYAEMALIEYYIERAKLRTEVVPALCKNGDVEGQYNTYVTWNKSVRHVVKKESVIENDTQVETITEEEIEDSCPSVEVIADADLVVNPTTCDSLQKALDMGGFVAITRRWTKAKIEEMVDDGEIVEDVADNLFADMKLYQEGQINIPKEHVSAAGIRGKGAWYLAREVWHKLKVDGKMRIVRSYFGSDSHQLLGTKLNPYWCDRIPVFSAPVKKLSGAFKGSPPIKRVARLQYLANDFLNQAADSATYALMPIVMTDPEKNPKSSSMILDLAAVWEVDPNSTKFAEFPPLWQQGFELIGAFKAQIQQSLGVNPSMIPSTSGKTKRSQADIANEQAVDLLTTADSVTLIEQGILTPMVEFFVAIDMQFRHDDLLIPMYGMMGKRAKMERIPPMQEGHKYQFKWLGVQAARNAAQIQQQISLLNVLKAIPPGMYRNHRIDATAVIESAVENAFGSRLAPLTFISLKDELSMPQEEENKYLVQGIDVPVSPMDDDADHLKKLQPLLQGPDPNGVIRVHAQSHMQAQQAKALQAQQQQMAQMGMQPGGPPGGGPRPGAQSGPPRGGQQAPGAIHRDQMPQAGAVPMPRKVG